MRRLWKLILQLKGRERWPVFMGAIIFGVFIIVYLAYAVWLLVSVPVMWVWGMVT